MLTFTPKRTTQPYRDPYRRPQTPQLSAMLLGRPLWGENPMDVQREMAHSVRLADLIRRRMAR